MEQKEELVLFSLLLPSISAPIPSAEAQLQCDTVRSADIQLPELVNVD